MGLPKNLVKDANMALRVASRYMSADSYSKRAMEFTNVSPTLKIDKVLDTRELSRVLRLSISAEQDAVSFYENISDSTKDTKIKAVFQDIANEEKVHIFEFQELLRKLNPDEEKFEEQGTKEVTDISNNKI